MNALTQALAAIHAATDARDNERLRAYRLAHLIQGRARRRAKVNQFMAEGYRSLMTWLSEDPAPRSFISTVEARDYMRNEIARIGRLHAAGHWAYRDNAHRLPGLRDRLVIATYFARFGAEIWQREAA